jgi:hypothetical protein
MSKYGGPHTIPAVGALGGKGRRISSGGQPGLHETQSLKKIWRWRGKLDHDKFLNFHSGKSIHSG